MPLTKTIAIESDQLKVGELEAFIGAARDAGSGVHALVSVDVEEDGTTRLAVQVSSDDDKPTPAPQAQPTTTDG